MNNPFGIPDDVFTAIVGSIMTLQAGQQKRKKDPSLDMSVVAKKSVESTKQLYDAYVEAGFTQEQAFELVSYTVPRSEHITITLK